MDPREESCPCHLYGGFFGAGISSTSSGTYVHWVGFIPAQRPQSTSQSNTVTVTPFKEDPQGVSQWARRSLILGAVALTLRRAPYPSVAPHAWLHPCLVPRQHCSARRDEQKGEGMLGIHAPAEGSPMAARTIG